MQDFENKQRELDIREKELSAKMNNDSEKNQIAREAMLNNQMRREILDMARATGFEGSILDLYQMANQGANVPEMLQAEAQAKQENMLVAQTPQEQQVGLREQHAMGNTAMGNTDAKHGFSRWMTS